MKENEVSQDVPAYRQQEGLAAAFEPFEEVRSAEADQALAGTGKVGHHLGFILRRRNIQGRLQIVGQPVAREMEQAVSTTVFVGRAYWSSG